MYGDTADQATPRSTRRLLLDYGGKTPTGMPMWRLVKAGDCRILCQGEMHHFPRGVELDINIRPNRIEGGRFLLPRYRDITPTDWILQKWFPPWIWGSAVDWKGTRAMDGNTAMFVQEFPSAGDYYMLAGPWTTVEAAGDLRIAISLYLRREREKPKDIEAAILVRMAEEKAEQQQKLEWLEREITRAEQALDPVWKSTGRAAQQAREEAAAAMGLDGHFGASEAWG